MTGLQRHKLSFLGNGWTEGSVKYSDSTIINYVNSVNLNQGVVTMDARINRNGSFTTLQLSQMKAIKAGVRDGLVITYKKIKNHITGKALDSRNVAQGSIVSQYNPSAISPNLEWQVILLGNGYYKIKNHANGMVLDGSGWFWMVLDGSGLTTDGATLYQNADITHSNLEWSLE